ncbi:toll/interleukin-1 receptor domain-containing protein, partial [Paenibacillus sp. P32E]|uniref:toll/interleukin-1 receptor domain-containing protein n=1 Tax=Paenibacillus sp. P32E TaxID=1349434 RepID=UPI00211689B2
MSYSKESLVDIVIPLIKHLEKFGLKIWFYKDNITLGKNIHHELDQSLNMCKNWIGAITVIDDGYFKKDWCVKEFEYFLSNNIPIFPVTFFKQTKLSEYNDLLRSLENEPILFSGNK